MTRLTASCWIIAVAAAVCFQSTSTAELFDRGSGLIYDDVLNVTWLQDANYAQTSGYDVDGQMTLAEAEAWAANLTYYDSVRGVTYEDWRLPNATDVGNDGATYTNYYQGVDYGFNITTHSELSYMFYLNLGNTAAYTTAGFNTGCGTVAPNYCLASTGPFLNLQPDRYWTNQQYGTEAGRRFIFYFNSGAQQYTDNGNVEYAWAVRDGDVGAPTQSITINTGNYTGLWDLDLSGDFVTGASTLDLEPGTYRFRAGTLATTLFFDVDASGNVTLAPEYDGISATGGAGVLNLLTRPITIDPGGFAGDWEIGRVRDPGPGVEIVQLIASAQANPSGHVGVPYRLAIGIGSSALIVYLRDDGSLGFDDGNNTFTGAVFEDNGTLRFNNTTVTVTDRNDSGAEWFIRQVTPGFGQGPFIGDRTLTLVPENQYLFQTSFGSSFFSISEPCAVAPEAQNTGGIIFDVTCGQPDADGDGVLNEVDNCPNVANPLQIDTDGDGFGDACDADIDNDGVDNSVDNCELISNPDQTDTDLDGAGNSCDEDDDGDNVLDGADNCSLVPNPLQEDTDGDLLGDACDTDLDGDSLENGLDNCPFLPNPLQEDTDNDGAGDDCDTDDDNDGVCDTGTADTYCIAGPDNCPVTPNADQLDFDSDNIGDACDIDIDGDGIDNDVDNCSLTPNSDQNDTDNDGLGDACDTDDDGDSILDTLDNCPFLVNPAQTDADGDGLGDICDEDVDGDGIDNSVDNCPSVANSDQQDLDGNGVGDSCDPDIDGDTVSNGNDECAATSPGEDVDPTNGCSIAQLCPCNGPRGTTNLWKNHGKYVSCTAHAANDFRDQGLITDAEKIAIVSAAAQSSCGKKN
jgi:hypothetical protein